MYENRENREGASKEQDCNLEPQLRRSGGSRGENIPFYVGGSPTDRIGQTRVRLLKVDKSTCIIFVGICHYSTRSDKRHKQRGIMSSNEIIARSYYVILYKVYIYI